MIEKPAVLDALISAGKISVYAGKPPPLGISRIPVLTRYEIGSRPPELTFEPSKREGYLDVYRDGAFIGRIPKKIQP